MHLQVKPYLQHFPFGACGISKVDLLESDVSFHGIRFELPVCADLRFSVQVLKHLASSTH